MNDPYVYPGTQMLVNRLNIRDQTEFQQAESDLSYRRIMQLRAEPIKGNFDMDHLKAIHKHIFGDLYDWAGQTRTVNIGKNGDWFVRRELIDQYANKVFEVLKGQQHLRSMSREDVALKSAALFANLNALHPFREGNGRAQREFIVQLVKQAGYELKFEGISKAHMMELSRDSFRGQIGALADTILQLTDPRRSELMGQVKEHYAKNDNLDGFIKQAAQPTNKRGAWSGPVIASNDGFVAIDVTRWNSREPKYAVLPANAFERSPNIGEKIIAVQCDSQLNIRFSAEGPQKHRAIERGVMER